MFFTIQNPAYSPTIFSFYEFTLKSLCDEPIINIILVYRYFVLLCFVIWRKIRVFVHKFKFMKMSTKKNKVYYFISHYLDVVLLDFFRINDNEYRGITGFFFKLLKKLVMAIQCFVENRLWVKASSLTYYTIFAIVPILALIFAISKGFGIKDVIENFIYKLFSDNQELLPYVLEFVDNYLEETHGGFFVGIGIILLLWSVLSMFRQIESNFNQIWNVNKNRSIVNQFTNYITILILVPLLIVLSNSISNWVDGYVVIMYNSAIGSFLKPIYKFFLFLLSYVVYWILFTFVFIYVPNTKVSFKDAFFSGIVSGTCILILQNVYFSGQLSLSKYNAVYGTFAAIPLLLMFLQFTWLIVLFGAQLCYVSQNLKIFNYKYDIEHISRRYSDYILIVILKIIINKFQQAESPISIEEISEKYNIPLRLVQNHIKLLEKINIVSEVVVDNSVENYYQPAMDIDRITINVVYDRLLKYGSEKFSIIEDKEIEAIKEVLEKLSSSTASEMDKIKVKDI